MAVAPAAADLVVARPDPVVQVIPAVQTAQAQATQAVPAIPEEATAVAPRQQKVTAGDEAPMTGWAMIAAVVLMMASAMRAGGAKKMMP